MGSFAIWGPSRADLDRLAWSVAEAIDPAFLWIEMTGSGTPPSSRELEVLEEIDLDRIERMDRADLLVPHHADPDGSAPPARPPGLPPRLHDRLARRGPRASPTALVLANLDRVLELVPAGSGFLPSLLAATHASPLHLIATIAGETAPSLDAFECRVHVSPGPEGNHWNPTVDWSSSEPAIEPPVVLPPSRTSHREAVRHFRAQRSSAPR